VKFLTSELVPPFFFRHDALFQCCFTHLVFVDHLAQRDTERPCLPTTCSEILIAFIHLIVLTLLLCADLPFPASDYACCECLSYFERGLGRRACARVRAVGGRKKRGVWLGGQHESRPNLKMMRGCAALVGFFEKRNEDVFSEPRFVGLN
jgi:hypothetical protein